ncbi:YdbL family protein [Enterobacteriaceae bacterium ESL0689]|nr:YdbL family protein [Enterobacteriaceae bacterium ESL0689]
MKKWKIVAVMLLPLFSSSVWSLTLGEARSQGRARETLSGYLAARQQDQQTRDLVAQINAARRADYQQLAEKNHLPLAQIAAIAGQKLVARAPAGEYVQGVDGQWLRK